ncbi:MFS transporter [Rhodoferax sp.]|uniref:MFS transporter n=1 Tax=Rhodoferax sp. TaxID=50421 RepID=UPI0025F939FF|nr:MFS transporter [Rhodoferax sp.]
MFAQPVSLWLQRRGIHFSWAILAIVFLTMLSSSAALGLPGAFLQPLSKEFGWSTDQISSAMALRFMLFGLMGPFAAILMERYGLRTIICTALVLVASGLLLATQMTALWQLVLLWGVLLGVGSGMTALVLGAVVATRWFDQRRGLVLGMLTASSATGQLVFLPLAAWLIERYGWRVAITPVFITCLLVALLAFCFIRNRPQDLGLRAFGANPDVPDAPLPNKRLGFMEPLNVLGSVSKSSTFWVLFGTFFVCGLSTSGLIQTHFISLCGDYGLAALPAASVLAMIGGFDFVGTILSGWLSDRFDNRKLLFWYYGLRGLSLFWLPHSDFTLYGLSLFAMFYGLDWVATVPPTVKLVSAHFSKERAGMIFGWVFAGHQLGSAVAAYGAGLTRTVMFSYTPALYVAGAACLVAATAILLAKSTAKPRSQPASA